MAPRAGRPSRSRPVSSSRPRPADGPAAEMTPVQFEPTPSAAAGEERDEHLVGRERAVPRDAGALLGQRRVDERDRLARREHDVADPAPGTVPVAPRAEPAVVEQLRARPRPTRGADVRVARRREQLGGRALRARRGSGSDRRRRSRAISSSSASGLDPRLGLEVHLTVIGGDEQRGVRRQRVEQRRRRARRRPRARPR